MASQKKKAVSAASVNRLHAPGKTTKTKAETVSIGDRVIINGTLSGTVRFYGNVRKRRTHPQQPLFSVICHHPFQAAKRLAVIRSRWHELAHGSEKKRTLCDVWMLHLHSRCLQLLLATTKSRCRVVPKTTAWDYSDPDPIGQSLYSAKRCVVQQWFRPRTPSRGNRSMLNGACLRGPRAACIGRVHTSVVLSFRGVCGRPPVCLLLLPRGCQTMESFFESFQSTSI
jgi:hypothetical protein